MRAVLDTNVLIAAFITEGICSKLLLRARNKQFSFVTCPYILKEFKLVLTKKLKASKKEAKDALELISEATQDLVHPIQKVSGVCRDPNDDEILACALTAQAEYIVTGDLDLLELKNFRGIRIVTPRDFELHFED